MTNLLLRWKRPTSVSQRFPNITAAKRMHTTLISALREACIHANNWQRENNTQLKFATKKANKKTRKPARELLRIAKALAEAA